MWLGGRDGVRLRGAPDTGRRGGRKYAQDGELRVVDGATCVAIRGRLAAFMTLRSYLMSYLVAAVSGCGQGTAAPVALAPATVAPPPLAATSWEGAAPLVLGETFHIDSKTLGERRVINVYLPPGYRQGSERYPVLYMPDGGVAEDFPHITGLVDVSIKNQVIRPLLVVAVENTERRRDLVGPTAVAEERKAAPHAGGADRFRAFLRDELKPAVAAHYRVTGESGIVGESLAGLFVLETLLVEPGLFDSYIAVDPSVWWNEQAVVRSAAARLTAWSAGARTLYVATADYKETQDAVEILTAALRSARPSGLVWHHQPLPDEHHNTIFPVAALRAFRLIWARPAN
jgi:predicted alpha/beta superfamily hydrolase